MHDEPNVGIAGSNGQVFIVGMNGSGTTMLLDHLANHSAIFGFPAETKSLPYFIRKQRKYGNLAEKANFDALWTDLRRAVLGSANLHAEGIIEPTGVMRTVAGAFDHLMSGLASASGKRIWCEKTPMHVHHLELLAREFPEAKFIHVIRDGRDCAASFNRRWQFNPVRTIYRWKKAVQAGRRQGSRLSGRYWEVRYEDVTSSPANEFRAILQFLGLSFEPSVLTSARARPNSTTPTHGKVERNERNASAYFAEPVVAEMESVAGKTLTELGYACDNPNGDRDPNRFQLRRWQLADDTRRLATFITRNGRLLRPSRWRYLLSHIRSALKQKATL